MPSFQSYNGFLYLCPIIIFSFLYNIPKFFEVQTRCSVVIHGPDDNNMSAMVRALIIYIIYNPIPIRIVKPKSKSKS